MVAKRRFDIYDPIKNLRNVEDVGLLNHETEFKLGTPSLERQENITLFGSNSNKETIYLKLKWRPFQSNKNAAHALVYSYFELGFQDGQIYKHEEALCYRPVKSSIRKNKIMQYGSPRSSLRLIILSPYRRLRILFTGYMQNKDPNSLNDIKFIKVNFLAIPNCGVFDFFDEYNESFLAKQFKECSKIKKKPEENGTNNENKEDKMKKTPSFKSSLKEMVLYDCHEQMMQIKGDCLVRDDEKGGEKSTITFYFWALHSREFPEYNMSKDCMIRKSLFVYGIDGRAFKLVRSESEDGRAFEFGYTSFLVNIQTVSINKKFTIDWSQVDDSLVVEKRQEFLVKVSNQRRTVECKILPLKSNELSRFLNVEMNGRKAYGFVTVENVSINSDLKEKEYFNSLMNAYTLRLEEGRILDIAPDPVGKPQDSALMLDIRHSLSTRPNMVGSKAASLALLSRSKPKSLLKFEIPKAFVFTKFAFDMIMNQNDLIAEHVQILNDGFRADPTGLNVSLTPHLKKACERLEKIIIRQRIPERLGILLRDKIEELYGQLEALDDLKFAVRSSSWGEDEEDMSAAGQLKTLLGVRGFDGICTAIMECFASKFNFINMQYKRQRGLPLNMPMAVIVQEMIDCDKAGVMFTCDPTCGDPRKIIITANYGIGESVVSGQSEPDTITLSRQLGEHNESLKIENISIGSKSIVIDGNSLENKPQPKNKYDRSKCCLSEEEILRIGKAGLVLANYFQSERDIEWGFKNGKLYLLQSRPITGLESFTEFELLHEADRPSRAEMDFFTRANLGEVLPYAMKPLTLSHSFKSWSLFTSRWEKKFRRGAKISPQTSMEIIINSYHPFMSMRNNLMSNYDENNKKMKKLAKSFQLAFFGHEITTNNQNQDVAQSAHETRAERNFAIMGLFLKIFTMDLRLMTDKIIDGQRKRIEMVERNLHKKIKQIYQENLHGLNIMKELYELNKDLLEYGARCWRNHGMVIMISSEYNGNLIELLGKYIKDDDSLLYSTIGKLLALTKNVISAEIPQRIKKISEMIRERGDAEKFSKFTQKEAIEYLSISPPPPTQSTTNNNDNNNQNNNNYNQIQNGISREDIAREFQKFLELFGHRCYNEFEISATSWRSNPGYIVDMLKKNSSLPLSSSSNKHLHHHHQQQQQQQQHQQQSNETGIKTPTSEKRDGKEKQDIKKEDENTIDSIISSIPELSQISLKDRLRLKHIIVPECQKFVSAREQTKDTFIIFFDILKQATNQLAKALFRNLRIPDEDLIFYLFFDELEPLIREPQPTIVLHAQKRRQMFKRNFKFPWKFEEIVRDYRCIPNHLKTNQTTLNSNGLVASDSYDKKQQKLIGTSACAGRIQGKICKVIDYNDLYRVQPGSILLTHSTDIGFSPVFPIISGIITEVGGLISHGAVVAREYGLPTVIGVPNVTQIISDGEEIILDADNGAIIRLNPPDESESDTTEKRDDEQNGNEPFGANEKQ